MKRDRIDDLRFFVIVAGADSLTAAARTMGISVSAVSKRLTELESQLGIQLVRRSSRRTQLTQEGERYVAGASRILGDLDDLAESVARDAATAAGDIRVRGTIGFGREVLAPIVGRFCTVHPEITVDLDLAPVPTHLGEGDFDLLVSVGQLTDSRFIVRRLMPNRRILCASPEYLARRGVPQSVEDLVHHDCILLREHEDDFAIWKFHVNGGIRSVRVSGNLVSSDGHVVSQWALAGLGIIRRSVWNLEKHLESGRLVEVLPELPTQNADVFAVYPSSTHMPRRVQLFLDFLKREIDRYHLRRDRGV